MTNSLHGMDLQQSIIRYSLVDVGVGVGGTLNVVSANFAAFS